MSLTDNNTHLPKVLITDHEEIDFFAGELTIFLAMDGLTYVSLDAIFTMLNLNSEDELARMLSHPALQSGLRCRRQNRPGDFQEEIGYFMRTGHFALWLSTLNGSVEASLEDPLIGYQLEAAQVLEEAFLEGRLVKTPNISRLIEENDDRVQSYKSTLQLLVRLRSRLWQLVA